MPCLLYGTFEQQEKGPGHAGHGGGQHVGGLIKLKPQVGGVPGGRGQGRGGEGAERGVWRGSLEGRGEHFCVVGVSPAHAVTRAGTLEQGSQPRAAST